MGLSRLQTPVCMPEAIPFIGFSKGCVTPRGRVPLLCGRAPGGQHCSPPPSPGLLAALPPAHNLGGGAEPDALWGRFLR